MPDKIIAVVGATGQQGGGLARAILSDSNGEFVARAITRNPESDNAKALAAQGAEVVKADLDDPASVEQAFDGAYGAYCVTNYWEHFSPDREKAQAKAMADAAKAVGIQHAIWSTFEDTRDYVPLDDDRMPTLQGKYKVPHFESKAEANAYFEGVPTTFLLTDLSLLNEAREFSEQVIDRLYRKSELKNKPRTYRQQARKAYLAVVKQRRPSNAIRRRGIKRQLQYLRRNLGHIERLLEQWPQGVKLPLPRWLLSRYWVLQHVYEQQWEMYRNKRRRCDDRIVSISQPYVRPIVRGKQNKAVEFGAKLSVSLSEEGLARVDHLRWDAFHEGHDLPRQVEAYRNRYGHYPTSVLGDPVYGTRDNRRYLKQRGIHFAGKPLGRPKQVTEANREELKRLAAQRREDYLQRIPIEGKFGQGKNGYRLNYIRAKRADTSAAWINSIFLVMNLLILLKVFFVSYARRRVVLLLAQMRVRTTLLCHGPAHSLAEGAAYQMTPS